MADEALVAFVRARLDEDEASEWPHRPTCQMVKEPATGFPFPTMSCNCDAAMRWIREVEAKRRILDEHERYVPELEHGDNGEWALDAVLRLLALPYADHPRLPRGVAAMSAALVAFFRARLDEAEREARFARDAAAQRTHYRAAVIERANRDLRDVKAKRRILEEYLAASAESGGEESGSDESTLHFVVEELVMVWDDHPDFDARWAL